MVWRLVARLSAASAFLCLAHASALAAACAPALAMKEGGEALEKRKDLLQRREWLYLEYLSTDGSKKSRQRLEQEVAQSQARTADMMQQLEALQALPTDTPEIPEEGTPACETITRVKTAIDGLMDTREKELAKATSETYPFLRACDDIGVKLVNLATVTRKPDTTEKTVAMVKITADIALGPQIHQARLERSDFSSLVNEVFADKELPPRAVAAYGALRCLRGYQGARIKPLPDAAPALSQCATESWTELGLCLSQAVGQ